MPDLPAAEMRPVFFVCEKIRHIAVVNINFVYEERRTGYAVCNFKR